MKKNSPLAAYKTARTNLWILLALSAVNVLFALLGSDTYFLFSCFISYLVAIYARVFYDYTGASVYMVIGILIALVILAVYLLCCLLSKKRRGWLIAALVLFSVDTAAMLLYYVIELSVTDILTDILDFVIHGLVLWILISGVRRSREALEGADTPESLPMNTEFYDASQGDIPNTPSLGQPTDKKHRTLLSAVYGSHEIEFRRMGAHIQVDGKVAVIEGVEQLTGAPVHACDLRAGAAMVIAGLSAKGVTEVDGIYHIERGYETLVEKLSAVGADIRTIVVPDEEAPAQVG